MSAQPRLVVSAPSSGHGKTAIAVGLLAAAAARGIPAAGFKVGPDHTDAAYLGLAAGRPGRNLDPRLVGAQRIAPLFAHGASGAQLAVVEGAMGLFDSLTGQPEIDGTAAVAAALRAPVVLVVDVAAMGHSLAALVHGFRMFDEMVHLGGVILNRVASHRHEQMLRTALDDIGMPVLGALRRGDLPNVLPARAHGPVPVAHHAVEAVRAVRRLGEAVATNLDLERLMALAGSAPVLPGPIWTPAEAIGGEVVPEQRPIVALAGGPGAPYTYVETAELLTAAGADVAVVDPLRDEALPAGTRALIVGAGLPEGYAEELSANRRLCNAVAKFAHDGWPVVAEGVGLPWLGRDYDGRPMCAVLDASATTGEQTVAGYREATAPTTSPLAPAGARITGYKQHRAVVTPRTGTVPAWTWSGGNPEGFVWRQVHASQLGLHWAAAPEIAKRLVAAATAGPVGVPAQPQVSKSAPTQPMPPPQPAVSAQPGLSAQPAVSAAPHAERVTVPVAQLTMGDTQQFPPVTSGVPHAQGGSAPLQGQVLPRHQLGGPSPLDHSQPTQLTRHGGPAPHQPAPHQAGAQQPSPHQPGQQQSGPQLGQQGGHHSGQQGGNQSGPQQIGHQSGPAQVAGHQSGSQQVGGHQSGSQQVAGHQSGSQQVGGQQSGSYQVAGHQSGPQQVGGHQAGPMQHAPQQAGSYQAASHLANPVPGAGPQQMQMQPGSPMMLHDQSAGPPMVSGPPPGAAMPIAGSSPDRELASYEARGLADTADIAAS